MTTVRAVVPGLLLAAALAAVATIAAAWLGESLLGFETSPVSPILLAVFLGLVVRNTVGVPDRFGPGLQLAVRRLLRIGVALLGIRLSLAAVATIGIVAVPLVAACIAAALFLVTALARALRLPPRLGLLIAAGTSICGITAIVAVAPVIDADGDETSYAVATIALFGMLTLFSYPFLAHALFDGATQAGLFLGTSIHDTSQVVGAALAYQEQFQAPAAVDTAVVTKLVRNLSMIAVIPLMGILAARQTEREAPDGTRSRSGAPPLRDLVPLFVVGFVAMAVLRTVGDVGHTPFGVLPPTAWERTIAALQATAEIALLLAMAAVGLGTTLRRLRALGFRPLTAGLVAALGVGAVSTVLIRGMAAAGWLPGP